MTVVYQSIFSKKISSSLCLMIIFFLAALTAAWTLYQSQKLTKLKEPLPFTASYYRSLATSTYSF